MNCIAHFNECRNIDIVYSTLQQLQVGNNIQRLDDTRMEFDIDYRHINLLRRHLRSSNIFIRDYRGTLELYEQLPESSHRTRDPYSIHGDERWSAARNQISPYIPTPLPPPPTNRHSVNDLPRFSELYPRQNPTTYSTLYGQGITAPNMDFRSSNPYSQLDPTIANLDPVVQRPDSTYTNPGLDLSNIDGSHNNQYTPFTEPTQREPLRSGPRPQHQLRQRSAPRVPLAPLVTSMDRSDSPDRSSFAGTPHTPFNLVGPSLESPRSRSSFRPSLTGTSPVNTVAPSPISSIYPPPPSNFIPRRRGAVRRPNPQFTQQMQEEEEQIRYNNTPSRNNQATDRSRSRSRSRSINPNRRRI